MKVEDPVQNMLELRQMEKEFYGESIAKSSQIRKSDADASVTAPVYTTLPDWAQPSFGRKVWSNLNYEKNVFAILPKARWNNSGWRMILTAAQSWEHIATQLAGGISRGGALPETIKVTPAVNATQPKEIMHTWGALEIDQFLSSIDDSIQIVPEMRAELGREHAAIMNTMLVQSVEPLAANATANWAGTNNLESLDRIVSSDAEEDACGGSYTDMYNPWAQYAQQEVDRDSGTTFDSVVKSFSGTIGTDGDMTISKIEELWRTIVEAGGEPDVILTGADWVSALSEILEPERRFVGEAKVLPSYGGVQGLQSGVEAGFAVATYKGTPIITTRVMRNTDATYGDTISKAFMLDTNYLELRVASPTRYMETSRTYDAYVAQNKLRIEGAYYTVAELICYRFNVQGKLRDAK